MVVDKKGDLRGCAVRIKIGNDNSHNFLMTKTEHHHAKDAVEAIWASF